MVLLKKLEQNCENYDQEWQIKQKRTLQNQPPEVFYKKNVLENFAKFSRKHLCQSLFFNKVPGLIKKETLAQVFSCEFREFFKSTFFFRTPPGDCF